MNLKTSLINPVSCDFELDPHSQFIYELALARLELRSFGVNTEPGVNLRVFRGARIADLSRAERRAAYFTSINGNPTAYALLREYNRTRSINQYLTHWFYPYKGKFHPQMARALLNIMQIAPGETALDPFMGSGTTALEAHLLGIRCIGVDISPLCVLVSRVKVESPRILDRVIEYQRQYEVIARAAARSKAQLHPPSIEATDDDRVRNFFKVAELIAHSDQTRRARPFIESYVKNIRRMSASVSDLQKATEHLGLRPAPVDIRMGDARKLPLEDGSIDGILTSPPYANALDYIENDTHAFRALGYNPAIIRDNFIGVRGNRKNRLDLYLEDIYQAFTEMRRVLRPGRWLVLIIGNDPITPAGMDLTEKTIAMCREIGFEFVRSIDKPIPSRRDEGSREFILMFLNPSGPALPARYDRPGENPSR